MKLRKVLGLMATVAMTMSMAVGCGSDGGNSEKTAFDPTYEITVITREEGSGTRGAFVELLGIEEKNAEGEKVDYTTVDAVTMNNTSGVISTVAGDEYAIGYVSLGSLNDTVKALDINGAEATEENIKNGSYEVARPFNIATKGEVSEVTQDFIDFILSTQGQTVVSENGYISLDETVDYAGTKPAGEIVVAGSTSVSPVMEKLKEAYIAINPNASIQIQTNDSSTGMSMVAEGTCDIGMASRELKDSEHAEGLNGTVIATDGIAVIVNRANTLEDIASEDVKAIYVGDACTWDEVIK